MDFARKKIVSVLICSAICLSAEGIKLPSVFKKCSISSPTLNECVISAGKDAIPKIINGVKSLKIPTLDPMKVNSIHIETETLNLNLKDIQVHGLRHAQLIDADINFAANKMLLVFFIPKVELIGSHEIHGRLLRLPVDGTGPAKITLINGIYRYSQELKQKEKKGEVYVTIKKHRTALEIQQSHYQLRNIFNGYQDLSGQVGRILNYRTNEVSKALEGAVSKTMSTIVASVLESVHENVPFEDILYP